MKKNESLPTRDPPVFLYNASGERKKNGYNAVAESQIFCFGKRDPLVAPLVNVLFSVGSTVYEMSHAYLELLL